MARSWVQPGGVVYFFLFPMTITTSSPGRVRVAVVVAVLTLVLFHGARLVSFFGGSESILSDVPLINQDHGWHYYYVVNGSRFLAETGTTSGYDPFLMAGHPTDVFDSSDRLLKLLFSIIPHPSEAAGYKLVVFFSGAIFPLVFFFAARLWGLRRLDSILTSAFGVWIWWEDLGYAFFDVGMTGFLLSASVAFLVAGLLAAYLSQPGPGRAAGLAIGLAFGLLIHLGIAPILAPPALALMFIHRRQLTARTLAVLAACGAIAVAANLFWILPLAINFSFAHGSDTHFQWPIMFVGIFGATIKHGHLSYLVTGVAGYLGFRLWRRRGENLLFSAFLFTLAAMLFIMFFGFLLPVFKSSQPVRYGMPLLFAPCFAAGCWLATQVRQLRAGEGRSRLVAGLSVFIVAATMGMTAARPARDPRAFPFVGVGSDVAFARDWIIRETTPAHRVLVEEHTLENDTFRESVPIAYLAMSTGREIIGGPHWATFLLHHHSVHFMGKMLLGSNMRLLEAKDFANLLAAYNIGWAVVRTPETVEIFRRFPEVFTPVAENEGFHFFRCPPWPQGFFLEGSGSVKAGYNHIQVDADMTQRGKVVLSYHWHPCLTVDPPRRLFRATAGDGQVGFVGVEGEGGSYEIRMRYPLFHSAGK